MYCIAFVKPAGQTDEQIAVRIGEIIYAPGFNTVFLAVDRKWNLAGQNDWWLRFTLDGRGIITSRSSSQQDVMEGAAAKLRAAGFPDARAAML